MYVCVRTTWFTLSVNQSLLPPRQPPPALSKGMEHGRCREGEEEEPTVSTSGTQTSRWDLQENKAQKNPRKWYIIYIFLKTEDAWPFSLDAIQKIPPECVEAILRIANCCKLHKMKIQKNLFDTSQNSTHINFLNGHVFQKKTEVLHFWLEFRAYLLQFVAQPLFRIVTIKRLNPF